MRQIKYTARFKRDFKRERSGRHGKMIESALAGILKMLVDDIPLPYANQDHPLSGEWTDHRDCHIWPDLILIYRKPENTLELVRLGSHSELGF